MKSRVAHQPALLEVCELQSLPVPGRHDFVNGAGFLTSEAGAFQLRGIGKEVRCVVIAEQENVITGIHSRTQPVGGVHHVPRRVAEVIEIIPEKHDAIVLLRLQPVVGVVRVIVNIRNDECAHLDVRDIIESRPACTGLEMSTFESWRRFRGE